MSKNITKDLTRQDESIAAAEFASDERNEGYDFGHWPEIAGFGLTLLLLWLSFAFTG